jgi:hypothetical protein
MVAITTWILKVFEVGRIGSSCGAWAMAVLDRRLWATTPVFLVIADAVKVSPATPEGVVLEVRRSFGAAMR